jgi:Cytochrome C and Quinol oxidase polypeptide I
MFVSGESLYAGLVFSFFSFAVAIPSAIKVFNWTATLYKGLISFGPPMLYMDSLDIATGVLSLTAPSIEGWAGKERADMAPRPLWFFRHAGASRRGCSADRDGSRLRSIEG